MAIEIIEELLPPVTTDGKNAGVGKHVLLGAPGYTPLQVAVRHNTDIAVYHMLLAHFSGPGYHTLLCHDINDETALMSVVQLRRCSEITQLLIDPDENVLFLSSLSQLTLLHVALETGRHDNSRHDNNSDRAYMLLPTSSLRLNSSLLASLFVGSGLCSFRSAGNNPAGGSSSPSVASSVLRRIQSTL